jgi:hypothetical protein
VSTTADENVRHRMFGSTAVKKTTDRPSGEASVNSPSGHSITRLTPSSSRTVGRVTWKSTNSSGSSVAMRAPSHRSIRYRTAIDAASPPSFQPRMAVTIAGRSRSGWSSNWTWGLLTRSSLQERLCSGTIHG